MSSRILLGITLLTAAAETGLITNQLVTDNTKNVPAQIKGYLNKVSKADQKILGLHPETTTTSTTTQQ